MKHILSFILWILFIAALSNCHDKSVQYKSVSINQKDTVKLYHSIIHLTDSGAGIKDTHSLSDDSILQKRLYGRWMVIKYSHSQLIKSATAEEWKRYRNKKIFLNPNLAVLFSDSCKLPDYKVSRQNAFWYFYNGYRERSSIGIREDTITIIELGCKGEPLYNGKDSPYFNTDIIMPLHGGIILYEFGLFLYLKKMK